MSYEKKKRKFIAKPVFVGGEKALQTYIRKQVKYPTAHLKDQVKGYVELRIDISSKGKVTKARVVKSLGQAFDQEAVRVAKLLRWQIPGSGGRSGKMVFHRSIRVPFNPPASKKVQGNTLRYQVTKKTAETSPPEEPSTAKPKTYSYTITIG